jgi:hypothetical protein
VLKPILVKQEVPDTLLVCAPEPVPGNLDKQSKVAEYIVDLSDAGEDCRSKLGAVSRILRQAN